MKKTYFKLIFLFLVVITIITPNVFAKNEPNFSLNSEAAILFDASSRSNFI